MTASSPALAGARAARVADMALPIIERLMQTLDAENEQIANRHRIDYRTYNQRKSQGLLELTRLLSAIEGVAPTTKLLEAMSLLRAKLDANQRMLRVQLNAARKVSDIIAKAIHDGQSDGTYSAFAWRDPTE
jgi:hypothetical protein